MTDKILHLLAGSTIAAAALPFGLLPTVMAAVVAAIGRELTNSTGFDLPDIAATLAGGVLMLGWLWAVMGATEL